MSVWREFTCDGVRLAWRDFGGNGPSVLLLHGLAGQSGEWSQTAGGLRERCQVVALDARGHGRSERRPPDVSRTVQVSDAVTVISEQRLSRSIVVGQSLGGLTAISLAARHPELVQALVLLDAGPPSNPEQARDAANTFDAALRAWPVPFASQPAATAFFAERFGSAPVGAAWADGLEHRADGLWPRFDIDVMTDTLYQALVEPTWEDWQQLCCPTLILRAGRGTLNPAIAQRMLDHCPHARLVDLPHAMHDLHLDQPDDWRATLTSFLNDTRAE